MNVAVRYCSQYGRTRAIAEEMAGELGVTAISVLDEPTLAEHVDVLFLGGAPYWSVMDPALEAYVKGLESNMIGSVVLFTTSNWSRRTVLGMRAELERRGISVVPGHFYAHMSMIEQSKPAARRFARETMDKIAASATPTTTLNRTREFVTEATSVLAVFAVVATVAAVVRRASRLPKKR